MKEILKGWGNFVLGLKTKEAKEKAKHCKKCTHKKIGNIEFIKDNQIKEIEGYVCNACDTIVKCPLSTKLRSDDPCPKGKF